MDPKTIIIITALAVMAVTFLRHRRIIALPFFLALLIALAWTSFYRYEYVFDNMFLFDRINLYPFVLWTVGLTQFWLIIHRRMPKRYALVLSSLVYLVLLGTFEAVAYHLIGIRLVDRFTSLLDLGVIHAPPVVKIFYIAAGPAYITILDLLKTRSSAPTRCTR